jgi:hypothetical protein
MNPEAKNGITGIVFLLAALIFAYLLFWKPL